MICPDRSFYNRSTDLVAMELLGNKLVRIISHGQKSMNGKDMTDQKSNIHIEFGVKPPGIIATKRIGTSKALDKKWRFISLDTSEKGYVTNRFASRRG